MMWTANPVRDDATYQADLEERRQKLPVCDCCGEHIESQYLYEVFGKLFCEVCMDGFKHDTDEYVEDEDWGGW